MIILTILFHIFIFHIANSHIKKRQLNSKNRKNDDEYHVMDLPRAPKAKAVSHANPKDDIQIAERHAKVNIKALMLVFHSILPPFMTPVYRPPNLSQIITSTINIAKAVRDKKQFHPIPNSFQGYEITNNPKTSK